MKKFLVFCSALAILFSLTTGAFAAGTRAFDEAKFEGMAISYSETNAPIVDDPNATIENLAGKGVITAAATKDTWCYRDKRLNNELFIIPEGKVVVVLQTDRNHGAALITYAGDTWWVYSCNLRLGK